jgi:potassium/hydrogen antiporter
VDAAIIITLCVLLLLAYLFDLTSKRTRIPSVILLLALGWAFKYFTGILEIKVPDLTGLLPILGTVGLILIVLEGSLELEINRTKFKMVSRSILVALIPMLILSFFIAFLFNYYGGYNFRDCLMNAIPLSVISSSIAISSGRNLARSDREFVVYESSLSDIFGVLFFNFVLLNNTVDVSSIGNFTSKLVLIILVSFVATLLLSILLKKLDHHIKFAPIILLVIVIYEVSKVYHLPSLIFILLFGLFLGNLDEFKKIRWITMLNPDELNKEVLKFKDITAEATFLIRALFFLLFGYLIELKEILNSDTFIWAVVISAAIFLIRAFALKFSGNKLRPLLFIAPRGLITILLYFAIDPRHQVHYVSRPLVLQVILITAFVMMFGMMTDKKKDNFAYHPGPGPG